MHIATLDCAPYQKANRFMRWAKLRTSCCLSLAKLTAVVEPVEGDSSIFADLGGVTVGITHVAAPFPAVIVLIARLERALLCRSIVCSRQMSATRKLTRLFTLFRSDGVQEGPLAYRESAAAGTGS